MPDPCILPLPTEEEDCSFFCIHAQTSQAEVKQRCSFVEPPTPFLKGEWGWLRKLWGGGTLGDTRENAQLPTDAFFNATQIYMYIFSPLADETKFAWLKSGTRGDAGGPWDAGNTPNTSNNIQQSTMWSSSVGWNPFSDPGLQFALSRFSELLKLFITLQNVVPLFNASPLAGH